MKNTTLVISLLVNLVLFGFYCLEKIKIQPHISNTPINNIDTIDYEISSMKNFENVYFDRNDSLYKELWGEAYQNQPQSAFLISCSYYFVTKDKKIIKDIEMSAYQMQDVYQRKFKIDSAVNKK